MAHRGALVDHLDVVLLEQWQPLLRIVARRLHYLHPTLDDGLDVTGVIRLLHRRQKGQVHPECLVGHLTAAANFLGQRLGRWLSERSNHAQPARIGYRRSKFGITDMVHAALDDGMLDTEEFCDSGFHEYLPSRVAARRACRWQMSTECRRPVRANTRLGGYSAGLWMAQYRPPERVAWCFLVLPVRGRIFQRLAASLDIPACAFHGVTAGHEQNHHSEQY